MTIKSPPAILIVTHNHASYVKALIDSCKNFPDITKYICDAASTDDTLALLKSETAARPDFRILAKSSLEGFSKNNNDLVREFNLRSHNLLLINPDCSFTPESLTDFLTKALSIENLGIAAPEIHYPDGRLQVTWRKYPSPVSFFLRRLLRAPDSNSNKMLTKHKDGIAKIEWALGAFLLVSNRFLELNNHVLLDERYRLYCEDADLCLTSYSHGLKVVGIANTGITHALQEQSRKRLSKYNYWNLTSGIKFMCKWNFRYLFLVRSIRSN